MIADALLAGTLFLFFAQPVPDRPGAGVVRVEFGQLTVHQRIIIRVPRMPERAYRTSVSSPTIEWRERRSERCVPLARIAAVTLTTPQSVDLLIDDGTRLRAHFAADCPSLDFYAGVYIRSNKDGRLCAKRDIVRARSGRQCPIRVFKQVVPRQDREDAAHRRRRLP